MKTISFHYDSELKTADEVRKRSRQYGHFTTGCHIIIEPDASLVEGRPITMPSMYDPDDPKGCISVLVLGNGSDVTGKQAKAMETIVYEFSDALNEPVGVRYSKVWPEGAFRL